VGVGVGLCWLGGFFGYFRGRSRFFVEGKKGGKSCGLLKNEMALAILKKK